MKRLIIAVLCAAACAVAAQETGEGRPPAPETRTPEQMSTRVAELRAEAGRMLDAAEVAHAAAEQDCWKKILVSACMEDAKLRLREARQAAKRLNIEAGRLERQAHAQERAARVERRAAEKQAQIEARQPAGN